MKPEDRLKQLIDEKLDACCEKSLVSLKRFIDNGNKEKAAKAIYNMCANEGISVQLAMANLDSEL